MAILTVTTYSGEEKHFSVHERKIELYETIIEIARQILQENPRQPKRRIVEFIASCTPASESTVHRVLTDYFEI